MNSFSICLCLCFSPRNSTVVRKNAFSDLINWCYPFFDWIIVTHSYFGEWLLIHTFFPYRILTLSHGSFFKNLIPVDEIKTCIICGPIDNSMNHWWLEREMNERTRNKKAQRWCWHGKNRLIISNDSMKWDDCGEKYRPLTHVLWPINRKRTRIIVVSVISFSVILTQISERFNGVFYLSHKSRKMMTNSQNW